MGRGQLVLEEKRKINGSSTNGTPKKKKQTKQKEPREIKAVDHYVWVLEKKN